MKCGYRVNSKNLPSNNAILRDRPKHAFALSRVLAETIGADYVEVALDTSVQICFMPRFPDKMISHRSPISAYAKLETADPKAEPHLQTLSVVRLVDLICHLWQKYVSTALLPLAGSSVTVRREMVIFNNQTVSRIEGAANSLTNRLADCMCSVSLSLY